MWRDRKYNIKDLSKNDYVVIATDHPNAEISNNIRKYAELYVPIDFLELYENQSLQEKFKNDICRNNQTLWDCT